MRSNEVDAPTISKGLRKRRFRTDTNVYPVFHLPLFNRPHIFTETLLNIVRPCTMFNVEGLSRKFCFIANCIVLASQN